MSCCSRSQSCGGESRRNSSSNEPSDLVNVQSNCVLRDPSILDGLDLTEEEKGELIDNINRRLTPQAVKIRAGIRRLEEVASSLFSERNTMTPFPRADIEVACYGYDGIDAVKDALRAGLGCSTEVMPIKVVVASATFGLKHAVLTATSR